jgi:Na+/H+ antiporter NhaD/arsenite permease-like protein
VAVAVATFLIALALIASERIHRTKVALLCAAIVVFVGDEYGQHAAQSANQST